MDQFQKYIKSTYKKESQDFTSQNYNYMHKSPLSNKNSDQPNSDQVQQDLKLNSIHSEQTIQVHNFHNYKEPEKSEENENQGFYCFFHPKNKLTNICLNRECSMPLCPECIKTHTRKHVQNNEEINYDTIEGAIEHVEYQLERSNQLLKQGQAQIQEFESLASNRIKDVDESLEMIREQLYTQVDVFVKQLKEDLNQSIQQKQEETYAQIDKYSAYNQKLSTVMDRYQNSLKFHENKLKTVTQIIKDDYLRKYNQDMVDFKSKLKNEKLKISTNIKQAASIQKSFQNFVVTDNLIKKEFDPLNPDNLAESIIVSSPQDPRYQNQPQIIQYQYTQPVSQNIYNPQYRAPQPQYVQTQYTQVPYDQQQYKVIYYN